MNIELTVISGLAPEERRAALRWLARQPEEICAEVMLGRFRAFHELRKRHKEKPAPVVDLCALLISCTRNGWKAERSYRSSKQLSERDLLQMARRRRLKAREVGRKPPRVREALAKNWGKVVELRREGLSYRAIASYLRTHHKLQISHTTICNLWKKWEKHE